MAKKAKAKPSAAKARTKQPAPASKQLTAKRSPQPTASPAVAKAASAPAPVVSPVTPSAPASSKYDQPGAPWWKKFRTERSTPELKRS